MNRLCLLEKTFKGSGYDIAVSLTNKALVFEKGATPQWQTLDFNPEYAQDILFIYSGKKRVSSEAIKNFDCSRVSEDSITILNTITDALLKCSTISEVESLMDAHENLISAIIGVKPIKEELFKDYSGSIKSLGAWGGDFFMATRKEEAKKYFSNKGYSTMFEWNEIIKQ